jgi:hypothetical protein
MQNINSDVCTFTGVNVTTVTAFTVILRWRSMNQLKIIFTDFSLIKDCFSLFLVFSDVLLCKEFVYTVALPSYNRNKTKSTVFKKKKKTVVMRVTVMCLLFGIPVTLKWDEGNLCFRPFHMTAKFYILKNRSVLYMPFFNHQQIIFVNNVCYL